MNDLQVRFKILFDILLSIEEGPDVESILLRSLRVMVRKLGCAAGAVFLPHSQRGITRFERAVSVPLQIENNNTLQQAALIVNNLSPVTLLGGQVDPTPIRRQIGERRFCYVLTLPEFGLLLLVKIGSELSQELLLSLHPISKRLAGVCLAQQTKLQLQESNERFHALVENAQDSLLVFDQTGTVVDSNGQARKRFGLSVEQLRAMDNTALGLVPPARYSWSQLFTTKGSRPSITWEQKVENGLGRLFDAEIRLGIYRFQSEYRALMWINDISERKELERERLRMERERERDKRLESLGLMTSGIAHDFNNMLAAIVGHTELGLLDAPKESKLAERLHHIEAAANNLTALTKQLLAFSGSGRFTLRPLDLEELAQNILGILRVSLSKKVEIILRRNPAPSIVMADAAQMEQLIMNLLTNAVEAYGEEEGIVELFVRREKLEKASLLSRGLSLEPGHFVILGVEDHACGMTSQQVDQIFEPFFTTKVRGKGLGLAAARQIARGHNGAIVVASTVGVGTKFEVLVPASEEVLEKRPFSSPPPKRIQEGTVLLVDDQPEVLETAILLLERLGFQVLAADNGREAISIYERNQHLIVAAVIDLTMPEMDGVAVYDALKSIRAELPVIFASGYTSETIAEKLHGRAQVNCVQKPYRLKQLQNALSKSMATAT